MRFIFIFFLIIIVVISKIIFFFMIIISFMMLWALFSFYTCCLIDCFLSFNGFLWFRIDYWIFILFIILLIEFMFRNKAFLLLTNTYTCYIIAFTWRRRIILLIILVFKLVICFNFFIISHHCLIFPLSKWFFIIFISLYLLVLLW